MSREDASASAVAAMVAFVRAVPATRVLLADHVACNGEIVPHVLMADLRQFLVYLISTNDGTTLAGFLGEIERLASSDDPSVRNVLDVAFIEDLVLGDPYERAAIEAMRSRIGPATAVSLETCERRHR